MLAVSDSARERLVPRVTATRVALGTFGEDVFSRLRQDKERMYFITGRIICPYRGISIGRFRWWKHRNYD